MSPQTMTPRAREIKNLPLPPDEWDNPLYRSIVGKSPLAQAHEPIEHCSYSEIISEELQNRLMTLDHAMTRCYFEIGDIANDLMLYAPQITRDLKKIVTEDDVCAAVGYYCHRSGRTVRYYLETARFYAEDVRAEFDPLPFSHFVAARSYGVRWREVLEYAQEYPTISEYSLRKHFDDLYDVDADSKQAFYDAHPGIADVVAKTLDDAGIPNDILKPPRQAQRARSHNSLLLSGLASLVDRLDGLLVDMENEDRRRRILLVLEETKKLVLELQGEVRACDIM